MRERDGAEGHDEATKALVLALAGLMISLMSNLVLLILY
jgi:hypothetical protein